MRKRGISPEYNYTNVPGTFNMTERKSFMGSKIMSVEDKIDLFNQDIIYYQQINGEQMNLDQEISINPVIYSVVNDKKENHQICLDDSQEQSDIDSEAKWIIDINIVQVLRNYIFTEIKNSRSFEGILNRNTINGFVNDAIYDYIDNNIIHLYEISKIDLFIKNISLQKEDRKRLDVKYNYKIGIGDNKFNKFKLNFNKDKTTAQILMTQEKDSKEYTFDYYFDLSFVKK